MTQQYISLQCKWTGPLVNMSTWEKCCSRRDHPVSARQTWRFMYPKMLWMLCAECKNHDYTDILTAKRSFFIILQIKWCCKSSQNGLSLFSQYDDMKEFYKETKAIKWTNVAEIFMMWPQCIKTMPTQSAQADHFVNTNLSACKCPLQTYITNLSTKHVITM